MKKKIDWKKVWESFDRGFDGGRWKDSTWETQAKKIKEIVERQLRR